MSALLPPEVVGQIIPRLSRRELSRLAERLIERLNEMDGDPDLEPEQDMDGANDDGCGPVYVHGIRRWGSEHDGDHGMCGHYRVDQAAPINLFLDRMRVVGDTIL